MREREKRVIAQTVKSDSNDTVGSTAVSISLDKDAAIIRVDAQDAEVFGKFGSAPTTSDFDFYVPSGQGRDFLRKPGTTDVQFISTGTAKIRVTQHKID